MAVNKLIFQSADKAKAAITDAAKKDIAKLYSDWADEIGKKAEYYKTKTTASSWLQEQNMRQLQAQLTATSHQISNEVYGIAKDSIYKVSDAVVQANNKWLIGLGFPVDGVNSAFVSVPDQTVRRLITGQIYESGWSLSKSIWSDNEKTLQDIYGIVGKGLAQNMSAYDISKLLETYVNPSRAKQWNLTMPDGVKIYKKAVDYNAQRLVRTLVQHGYQQSFIATTQKNPFIEYYIWRANGSRTCELCAARDGKKYAKDELPMDHPNGMCTMEPYVDNDNMIDQLADWVNNPDGTYPEIDEFAKQFGYDASNASNASKGSIFSLESFKNKFGNVTNQNAIQTFKSNLSNDAYSEWFSLQKQVKKDLGYTPGSGKDFWADYSSGKIKSKEMDAFFNKNLSGTKKMSTTVGDGSNLTAKKKVATEVINRNMWYDKLNNNDLRKMEKWCDGWTDLITSEERYAVEVYTGSAYKNMNAYLRGQISSTSYADEIKQATAALKKARLPEEVIVRRGSDYNMLRELGIDISEANKDKMVGALVTDKGFMSTSPAFDGGFSGDIEYVIKVPKGSQAMYVDTISQNRGEEELLINRGGKYIIEDVEFDSYGGVKKIYMTLKNLKGSK